MWETSEAVSQDTKQTSPTRSWFKVHVTSDWAHVCIRQVIARGRLDNGFNTQPPLPRCAANTRLFPKGAFRVTLIVLQAPPASCERIRNFLHSTGDGCVFFYIYKYSGIKALWIGPTPCRETQKGTEGAGLVMRGSPVTKKDQHATETLKSV